MKRFLIIGASGQVGSRLRRRLADFEVAAPTHSELDLADHDGLRRFLRDRRFDAILIPGAMSNVDACEADPRLAHRANAEAPGIIAEEARGAFLVFFSTDQVFDGRAGPYRESDPPSPLSVYGRTKVEAEQRARSGRALIIRTCHVFSYDPGDNFFMFVSRRLLAGQKVRAYTDQWTTPTDAEDLADETIRLMREGREGIVHLAGREGCTRFEFASEVARAFGRAGVEPALLPNMLRGKRTGLVSTLPSWREGVARHRSLYT